MSISTGGSLLEVLYIRTLHLELPHNSAHSLYPCGKACYYINFLVPLDFKDLYRTLDFFWMDFSNFLKFYYSIIMIHEASL